MDELIKEVQKMRDVEANYQKKCKCEDENNSQLFFYMEGRISAFSDIIIQYYYHYKDEEVK